MLERGAHKRFGGRQRRSLVRMGVALLCQCTLLLALLPATNEARGAEGNAGFAKETIEFVTDSRSEPRASSASSVIRLGSHYSHKVALRVLTDGAVSTLHAGHRLANGLLAPLHC